MAISSCESKVGIGNIWSIKAFPELSREGKREERVRGSKREVGKRG